MVNNRTLYIVVISFFCLFAIPMNNLGLFAEGLVQNDSFELQQENDKNSWSGEPDIEAILNIYGSTSAGNNLLEPTIILPYEEIGVYGVEYENLFLDTAPKQGIFETTKPKNENNKASDE